MPDSASYTNPDSKDFPYRTGYRDGFRDGWLDRSADARAGGNSVKTYKGSDQSGAATGGEQNEQPGKSGSGGDANGKGDADGKDRDGDKHEDKGKDKDKEPDDEHGKKPLYKRPFIVALVLLVVLAAIIAAIVFWRHSSHHEKTDDAFVDGHAAMVASQSAGRVVKLLVTDNQLVHAGDLLVEVDSRDSDARAAQARAQLADAESQLETAHAQVLVRQAATVQAQASTRQAQAELAKAQQDESRLRRVDPDAVARSQVDASQTAAISAQARLDAARSTERSSVAQTAAAQAQVRTAEAGIEAARAQVSAAELQVSYSQVFAPADGHVTRRTIEVGNVIAAGQSLMAIVSDSLWVTANYKETQLTRMQPGQAVEVTVDAFPDVRFKARVDSIQRGTGSYFSMLPAENATGNFVKVVQRVPVKIVFDDASQLKQYAIGPGMSAAPDVSIP